ncbi:CENP-S complex centromere protein X [Penicillium robsamsonii]|uniref:CENP-S complex centromere protein X n=1 Tax=Penicillium robsamsonii TaxID=1792511 RepID=UPI0025468F4C|nr:CENP-S complex centromere protein X [Penicillium robsamsonii]KAJ5826611.1 CENP-S complex centromere protein X [Penicillium robsamsonii]
MPGEPQPAQKRPRLPFKPPSRTTSAGPSSSAPKTKGKAKQTSTKASASTTVPKTTKSKPTTQSKPTAQTKSTGQSKSTSIGKRPRPESPAADANATSESESESDSSGSSRSRSRSLSQEPDYILAEITTTHQPEDVTSSDPKIPSKLLTRLLHQHFQNEKTKVAKDANNVVAKYIDVFVREAIARAAYERAESDGNTGGRGLGDGFLEVSLHSFVLQLAILGYSDW